MDQMRETLVKLRTLEAQQLQQQQQQQTLRQATSDAESSEASSMPRLPPPPPAAPNVMKTLSSVAEGNGTSAVPDSPKKSPRKFGRTKSTSRRELSSLTTSSVDDSLEGSDTAKEASKSENKKRAFKRRASLGAGSRNKVDHKISLDGETKGHARRLSLGEGSPRPPEDTKGGKLNLKSPKEKLDGRPKFATSSSSSTVTVDEVESLKGLVVDDDLTSKLDKLTKDKPGKKEKDSARGQTSARKATRSYSTSQDKR